MSCYPFRKDIEGGIILISLEVNDKKDFQVVLDTGASHTSFDRDALIVEGYQLDNPTDRTFVETSNGVIEVDVFLLESLSAFGITRRNVQVQVYDFLAHDILSSYQGVLGLDFFEGTQFTINMVKNTIAVKKLQ
jgi:predicted aspartyl protease